MYRFVFAFTPYADELPNVPIGPMTLPLDFRYNPHLVANGPTRGLYLLFQAAREYEHTPISTDNDIEKAVAWVRTLPEEALGRRRSFPPKYLRHLFDLLKRCTHHQRTFIENMLKAHRRLLTKSVSLSKRALAGEMGIDHKTLLYHEKNIELNRILLNYIMGGANIPSERNKAFRHGLSIKGPSDPIISEKPME